MNMEIIEKKRRAEKLAMIKSCAKALYLVGNLEQMFVYLDALVDDKWITEYEESDIAEAVSFVDGDVTWDTIKELRNRF